LLYASRIEEKRGRTFLLLRGKRKKKGELYKQEKDSFARGKGCWRSKKKKKKEARSALLSLGEQLRKKKEEEI